jgi:hypothetical protein
MRVATFAVAAALLVLVACVRGSYPLHDDLHHRDYSKETMEREGETCSGAGLRVCPTRRGPMGHYYSEHVQCVLGKWKQMPLHCRAAVLDLEHCVADFERLCENLNFEDTQLCMEHHRDEVTPECLSSYFFRELHINAKRSLRPYRNAYNEYQALEARLRGQQVPHFRFVEPDMRGGEL